MEYKDIIDFWQKQQTKNSNELSVVLNSYAVNFAYNSGKIENDKITYHDTREIFDKDGVSSYTGDLKTLFEIQNAKTAYEFILQAYDEKQSINEAFVKKVQKLLTKGTYDKRRYNLGERPGEYKLRDYVVGKNETGASSEVVAEEMQELLAELEDVSDFDALTVAAYFHAKFENIHPFSDGNGRTGRLLMNYLLISCGHPPIIIHEEDRKGYYDALEAFDVKSELIPLIDFLKGQLVKTWGKSVEKVPNKKISLDDVIKSVNSESQNTIAKKHSDDMDIEL